MRTVGPHTHGLPCWQPHWHVEATTGGVWQPQVQAAPTQLRQVQCWRWVFMVGGSLGWQTGVVEAHSGNPRRRGLERKG